METLGLLLFKGAAFLVALGVLVVIHEYGHYWVARRCNVKVLRFSVGFGKPLKTWVRGADQTEWVIAAVPLGGYVKMLDEREAPVAETELPRAFNRQNVWKRFAIVLAGPVANLLLAIGLYWVLFLHGVPGMRPVVGAPVADSAVIEPLLVIDSTEAPVSISTRFLPVWIRNPLTAVCTPGVDSTNMRASRVCTSRALVLRSSLGSRSI